VTMMKNWSPTRTGRPSKRADWEAESVGISFRVKPGLKNLLLDISEGSGMSMTEWLELALLRESGFSTIEDYVSDKRDGTNDA
jgi:hypothetical protein